MSNLLHKACGINISNRLRTNYVFPVAAFIPFLDTQGYVEYQDGQPSGGEAARGGQDTGTDTSRGSGWRIDHASFGVRYVAIPESLLPMPPLRIEVVVPDQMEWPADLWSLLDAKDSVHVTGSRISMLGISRHLCKALGSWSSKIEDFEKEYKSLPFASVIKASSIKANPFNMEFTFVPNTRLPGCMLSASTLRTMWSFDAEKMPPEISLDHLRFVKQLSGEVILVSVSSESGDKLMVFKSQRAKPALLYHELKVLLSLPPSSNIIEPPVNLVTILSPERSEHRVCGFLLEYYEMGSLETLLPARWSEGNLSLIQQLNWARDLTSALLHIYSQPGQFYSDLRMDQILLRRNDDGSETAVLADLEQSRNLYNWAPPEICYLEWIAELADDNFIRSDLVDNETIAKYSAILTRYLTSKKFPLPIPYPGYVYDNPPHGWYFPWLASTPEEQESGTVFQLGKALWCFFEGVGDADIILGRSNIYEAEQRFPEFRQTPESLRGLIRNCTAGAREWIDGPIKIYRRGGKVFPLGKTGLNGEPEGTVEETKQAIKAFWLEEMSKAESFVSAKESYDAGGATEEDLEWLQYLRRPTLKSVMESLDAFHESMLPHD